MNRYFQPLIQRICQAAHDALRPSASDGMVIVTVRILVTREGKPLLWTVSQCDKIEPATRASDFLEGMAGGNG